jgi:hypothetical protein
VSEPAPEPMGWPAIIGAMVVTGLVTGVTLGLLRDVVGYGGGTAGVGAAVGIVGALLITRRNAALKAREKPPEQ